jgi:pyruvate,water dikinase
MSYGWDVDEFQGEEDIETYKLWILDIAHFVPAVTPLYYQAHGEHCRGHPFHLGSDYISDPGKRGSAWRTYKGYTYITADTTTDGERREREPKFREKMTRILQDPWAPWNGWKAELKFYYDRLIPMNPEQMGNGELASHLWDVWEVDRKMWEIHHLGWHTYGAGLGAFRDMAAEMIGLHYTDPLYAKLMSGFDNALFHLNKGLAELATKAMEVRVEDTFRLPDDQVLPAMQQSTAGKQWLDAFHHFLYEEGVGGQGWTMQRMLEFCTPTWFEKPSLAIANIRRLMAGGGVHTPDLQRERLVREREEAEREVLAKVPAADWEWFAILMRTGQAAQSFCEDHDYWCEFRAHSLVRRAALEAGRRLVKVGIMDDPEDALMLLMETLVFGAAGLERNAALVKPRLKSNKEEWLHNVNLPYPSDEVPMFLGDPSWLPTLVAADTLLNVQISPQLAKPEEVGATCVGAAGAPGVAEGVARVIRDHTEWDQLQSGEILVAPLTMATWTPLFSTIKAVVTDSGGMLSHPVIVGREYGIPAVAGTMDATQKIKTGDQIRVDGNLCRVYVLKRAE